MDFYAQLAIALFTITTVAVLAFLYRRLLGVGPYPAIEARGPSKDDTEGFYPEAPIPSAPPSPVVSDLPTIEPYYQLPDRELVIEDLIARLRDPRARRLIIISGIGGIGKTATAVEVGRRCLEENLFRAVLFKRVSQEWFADETGNGGSGSQPEVTFTMLLDEIAESLRLEYLQDRSPEVKEAELRLKLQERSTLIILDGLEREDDSAALVRKLAKFLGRSRAIVTSRLRLTFRFAHTVSLSSLSRIDGMAFLREEARAQDCGSILEASEETLDRILSTTGGNPLALKLVVGQVRVFDLDTILRRLNEGKSDLFQPMFANNWRQLSPPARQLLVRMAASARPLSYEKLQTLDGFEDEEAVNSALMEAIKASLINVSEVHGRKQYSINTLTRSFVHSVAR